MVLIFSSCLDNLYLGLVKNEKLSATKKIIYTRLHSEKMVNEIMKFLKENNSSLEELNTLFLTNGPGGFTGVRLGVLFAKTSNIISNIKIRTIDTLSSLTAEKNGLVSLDAKSGLFYTGTFKEGKLVGSIEITRDNKTNMLLDDNIIENMFSKIKYSKVIDNFKDLEIEYLKKI